MDIVKKSFKLAECNAIQHNNLSSDYQLHRNSSPFSYYLLLYLLHISYTYVRTWLASLQLHTTSHI
jgi:hypothetical protein